MAIRFAGDLATDRIGDHDHFGDHGAQDAQYITNVEDQEERDKAAGDKGGDRHLPGTPDHQLQHIASDEDDEQDHHHPACGVEEPPSARLLVALLTTGRLGTIGGAGRIEPIERATLRIGQTDIFAGLTDLATIGVRAQALLVDLIDHLLSASDIADRLDLILLQDRDAEHIPDRALREPLEHRPKGRLIDGSGEAGNRAGDMAAELEGATVTERGGGIIELADRLGR